MKPILQPGVTCWRIEHAPHVAFLLDSETYFAAFRRAISRAERSITLLGWQFDPRTSLTPRRDSPNAHDRIGIVLRDAAATRPELQVSILIWDASLVIAATRKFFPQRARAWFGSRVRFHLDDRHPLGASHHQKVALIDDAFGFCASGDFGVNRWDSAAHEDGDPRRRAPSGILHPPRHDVALAVDGPAAAALGELARQRWERATGTRDEPACTQGHARWPEDLAPDLEDCPVGIARTEPAYRGRKAVRENEALYLRSIAAARRLLYFESEYFASSRVAEALEARLNEPCGPEVVIVLPARSPGYSDRLTMDSARDLLLERLESRDPHGRLHVYVPVTRGATEVIVHSKLCIVDDRLLRVGSSNLNNRSLGFDTECDMAVDAALVPDRHRDRARRAIRQVLHRLVAHYIDVSPMAVEAEYDRAGSISSVIEALQTKDAKRLRRLHGRRPRMAHALIARYHLGDPESARDSWRPWRRHVTLP